MSKTGQQIAQSAVNSALDRARNHMGTAAVAAALVPLASLAPGAAQAKQNTLSISTSFNNISGQEYETFTIHTTAGVFWANTIDIPELHAGDLNFGYNGNTNTGSYSSILETSTPAYAGALTPTTTEFIEITFPGNSYFGSGSSLTLTAEVPTALTVSATAGVNDFSGSVVPGGPTFATTAFSIPDTSTPSVPEPGTMALLASGIAGVMGLRRRRR